MNNGYIYRCSIRQISVIRRCWFSCCEFVSARLLISNFPHVRNFALISVVFRSLWLDSFYRIICRFFKAELFFWSSILKLDFEARSGTMFFGFIVFPTVVSRYIFCVHFYYSTFCHQLIQVWNRMCAGGFFGTLHMHAPSSQGGKNNNQRILYASKFQTIKTTAKISPKIPKSRKIQKTRIPTSIKIPESEYFSKFSYSKVEENSPTRKPFLWARISFLVNKSFPT